MRIHNKGLLTVILGGSRSGKSAFAEDYLVKKAQRTGGRLVYIASGTATDAEMQARIDQHRLDRAHINWTTLEQSVRMEEVLPSIRLGDLVLWDCATTWLANELYEGWDEGTPCIHQPGCMEAKEERLYETVEALRQKAAHLIIVSNEVLDDIPMSDPETKIYMKWLGRVHRELVRRADEAIEMDYGVAMYWKRGRNDEWTNGRRDGIRFGEDDDLHSTLPHPRQ
ncbi:bifunctional adenosylcobinamide kinase/adenosylcobinamide-phosphate guanylyltransferase [Sporosarcina sp. 179-K 3D1 HS]|uniref:bifunctional adenosylcobinamide kinase/adenosylcobinamide-phosphate guanylyltransferase n=1 Tax=Sporosarcina sp. 179-K 3D1 HS TaxID=3232169 RepID=UPI0039A077D3